MNVKALERVVAAAQMQAPHAAGLELVSEGTFDALAAPALQPLAPIAADPPTVRVHDGLQVLLACPTTTTTVRLRDVAAKLQLVDGGENVVAVVALVRNHFLDHRRIADCRLHLLERLLQRLVDRLRVSLGAAMQRHTQNGPALQVHRLLRLVREVRAAILHLRDLGIRIVRILPLLVRQLLLPLAVETSQLRTSQRRQARSLCQATHELLVARTRIPTNDAAQRSVRLQRRRVHAHCLPRYQTRLRQALKNPAEHLAVSLQIDQTTSARNRRMIRRTLRHTQAQEPTNAQRVLSTPGDLPLRIQTLEEAHHQQPEVRTWRKTRTTHPLRVEPRTLRLDELVETARLQHTVQTLVERMAGTPRQSRSRHPEKLLILTTPFAHSHEPILSHSRNGGQPDFCHGLLTWRRGAGAAALWSFAAGGLTLGLWTLLDIPGMHAVFPAMAASLAAYCAAAWLMPEAKAAKELFG